MTEIFVTGLFSILRSQKRSVEIPLVSVVVVELRLLLVLDEHRIEYLNTHLPSMRVVSPPTKGGCTFINTLLTTSNKVYVSNLSWHTSSQDLKAHMSNDGDVRYAEVLTDRDGRSKCCAIVEFTTVKGAQDAIKKLTGTALKGRTIFVRKDRGNGMKRGSSKSVGKENASNRKNLSIGRKALTTSNKNSASIKSAPNKKHTVETVELVGGMDSLDKANDLRKACLSTESMLQVVLHRVGFNGCVVDENSNITGASSFKVAVKKSMIIATADEDPKLDVCVYSVVLEMNSNRAMSTSQKRKLTDVFAKYKTVGFVEWLEGKERGWRFDNDGRWKPRVVLQFNTLQDVFKLFARDNEKYYFPLEKKRMVWRKHAELTEIISDVRVWIEHIEPSELSRKMLRNSNSGPDSLVHWAHHHPQTDYPLTVVSEASMAELVEVSI